MRRNIACVLVSLSLVTALSASLTPSPAHATSPEAAPHKWLREVGLLTGYASALLTDKRGNYEVIPILPQFVFDINPLVKKLRLEPPGTVEGMIEPLMNVVINPDTNAEVGCSGFLRYSQKVTSRIAPYIEGGIGMIYTTQHTHEQGTQFNFITQAGVGLQFFLTDTWAITGGYRFRHLSNADLSEDNEGIDHHFALMGLSYFFK